jgi:hypothetical protein
MPKQRTKIFHQKVLHGNIRGDVRYLTERGKRGILYLDDTDEKTGKTIQLVLEWKHPNGRTPSADTLTAYLYLPDFMDLDITKDSIKVTACPKVLGSEGWKPTIFSSGCCALAKQVAPGQFLPAMAAYQALMAGCLVALDKCPGVCPIGIGKIWWRLTAKVALLSSGSNVKKLCRIDQLKSWSRSQHQRWHPRTIDKL